MTFFERFDYLKKKCDLLTKCTENLAERIKRNEKTSADLLRIYYFLTEAREVAIKSCSLSRIYQYIDFKRLNRESNESM